MTSYPGKKTYFMMKYESVEGTAVTPTIGVKILEEDIWTKPQDDFPEEYAGTMENISAPVRKWQESGGGVRLLARPGGPLETLLWGAFGTVASTPLGTSPNYYQHTFTVNSDTIPSFSIGKGLSTLNFLRYSRAKIKTFSMISKEREQVEIDTDWISEAVDRQLTALTPTYATPGAFGYLGATVSIDGTTSDSVKEITVKIDRATEGESVMDGTMEYAMIDPGNFICSVEGTAIFKESEYLRYLGDPTTGFDTTATPLAVKVKFTGDTIVTGTPHQLEWDFPEMYYTAHDPKFTVDDKVKVTFVARAVKNTTAGYSARAIAITTAASPLSSL